MPQLPDPSCCRWPEPSPPGERSLAGPLGSSLSPLWPGGEVCRLRGPHTQPFPRPAAPFILLEPRRWGNDSAQGPQGLCSQKQSPNWTLTDGEMLIPVKAVELTEPQ